MTVDTVIIGAGISGLTLAWLLQNQQRRILLLEAADRVGGTIGTLDRDGFQLETGPNSTLQKPGGAEDALGRLIDQVGLAADKQEADSRAGKRYIVRHGRLRPLPASPPAFLFSSPFSWQAKLRLLAEPFIQPSHREESIAAFVKRRLGQEMLDYAIEPFISGVYAGNPAELSVMAAVPRIYALEQQHGSLLRGAMAMGRIHKQSGMPRGRLISFRRGMAQLPQTIAARLSPGTLSLSSRATAIEPIATGWRVSWQTPQQPPQQLCCRSLVLATPAPAAAQLLAPFCPDGAALLRSIPYAPVVSCAVGYRRQQIQHPLDGFGFLVPQREQLPILGALFSSTIFPDRSPTGDVLLTVFIGGQMDPAAVNLSDERIMERLQSGLQHNCGVRGKPHFIHIQRYQQAIPQYTLGHLQRINQLQQITSRLPGLHMQANWRGGVSVADCVRQAEQLAQTFLSQS
ncbi:MAG: protoporphyrinogen oxidase [Magnetococcales bacterium]|nr:protoporphyrinogen oxidase [Magnetococcales bacterium]